MHKECTSCGKGFETDGITVKRCPSCMKAYRIAIGKQKPDGWERKTSDISSYMAEWKKKNKEKLAIYEKRRKRTPEYNRRKYENKMKRLYGDAWKPREKITLTDEEKAKRKLAISRYRTALRRGKITRLPCFVCGNTEVDGHHPDYSMPLDVVWLCKEHHKQLHKEFDDMVNRDILVTNE